MTSGNVSMHFYSLVNVKVLFSIIFSNNACGSIRMVVDDIKHILNQVYPIFK